ncbi:MAG: pseudouridine synthase [Candidatus Omnitrophica bacterium]|nr:pseudouridine synthase [Candidatus Omnitrophota bacterium]
MSQGRKDKYRKTSLSKNIIRTISKSGLCSRKQALELVMAGKVKINGKTVVEPGHKVRKSDHIIVDEKPLPKKDKRYILLHKPAGYVTTRKDELGRPTVYDFIKDIDDWVFPVGRLDLDSEGLLIFTNDTKLGNLLTEPRYKISRTYEVLITGQITPKEIKAVLSGIDIGRGEKTEPISLKILSRNSDSAWVEVMLKEGKNREIRRLFEVLNKPVKRLIRTRFGPFKLGSLKPGKWIELKTIPPEMSSLEEA